MFIELTNTEGIKILINVDKIQTVMPYLGRTSIQCGEDSIFVKEEDYAMIKERLAVIDRIESLRSE